MRRIDTRVRKRKRRLTGSPRRSNYFIKKTGGPKEESLGDRLGKIPLEQDEQFLKAIKQELLGLMNRVRSETKQKLELLKQLQVYRERERNKHCATIAVQCDLYDEKTPATRKASIAADSDVAHPDVVVELMDSTLGDSGRQASGGAARIRYESFSEESSARLDTHKQQEDEKAIKAGGERIGCESDIVIDIKEKLGADQET